jgi:hypothetical protein
VSPASGGPYLPANYAPRPANYNPGEPQIATRTAGHSVPLETTVEPVTAAPVVTGNTTVAQAMSAQESCQKQLQDYLDGLAPRKRSFTREGYDAQRRAFAKTHSVKVATELAPKAVADRAEQARQKVREEIDALKADGDLHAEIKATRIWARTKHLLDSQDSAAKVSTAAKLVNDAKPAELATYLQELPSYLEAEGLPSDFLNPILEQKVPAVANAINQHTLAVKASAGITNNAARLGKAAAEGRQTYIALLDYSVFDPDANHVA